MALPIGSSSVSDLLQLLQGGATPAGGPFDDEVSSITKAYPALAPYDWSGVDSRAKGISNGRQLEFYPPEDPDNPTPGKPTIEVFNPELQGEALKQAILGDMLHHLPSVDPGWAALRQKFLQSLTPEQDKKNKEEYAIDREQYGETAPYDQWMQMSRLDAYLRGYLTPDKNDNWSKPIGKSPAYTPEQLQLLEQMREHLEGGTDNPLRRNFKAQKGQEHLDQKRNEMQGTPGQSPTEGAELSHGLPTQNVTKPNQQPSMLDALMRLLMKNTQQAPP
jgi:hypothetical protein